MIWGAFTSSWTHFEVIHLQLLSNIWKFSQKVHEKSVVSKIIGHRNISLGKGFECIMYRKSSIRRRLFKKWYFWCGAYSKYNIFGMKISPFVSKKDQVTSLTENINVLVIFFILIKQLTGFFKWESWSYRTSKVHLHHGKANTLHQEFVKKGDQKSDRFERIHTAHNEEKYPYIAVILLSYFYLLQITPFLFR